MCRQTVERLKFDGSNIDEWIKGINTIGLMVFGIGKFTHNIANLQELNDNKRIIVQVFFTLTINRELQPLIEKELTAAGAFKNIQKNFQLLNRTRQIKLWDELFYKLTTMEGSISSHLSQISNIFIKLNRLGSHVPNECISLVMQVLTPPPPGASCMQMLQSISPQLDCLKKPTAANTQSIITLCYTKITWGNYSNNPYLVAAVNPYVWPTSNAGQRPEQQTGMNPTIRTLGTWAQQHQPTLADIQAAQTVIANGNQPVPDEIRA